MATTTHPLAYNSDGTAVDPIAFRDALMADPEKLRAIEAEKELAAALLGDDTAKIQETLKMLYQLQKKEADADNAQKMMSSDILRAQCPVPRDPTVLYENMLKVRSEEGSKGKRRGKREKGEPD